MKHVHIGEALRVGWSKFLTRPLYLFGITLLFIVLLIFTSSSGAMVAAMGVIAYTGYLSIMFKHYHNEHVILDDLFSIDGRWIYLGFLVLIKGLLIMLGLICFVVPGIYLAIRFMFAELFVIDCGMRPVEALRASVALTKGHWWKLFFFSLIAILISLIGTFILVVGVAIASAVLTFAVIHIYYSLRAAQS